MVDRNIYDTLVVFYYKNGIDWNYIISLTGEEAHFFSIAVMFVFL